MHPRTIAAIQSLRKLRPSLPFVICPSGAELRHETDATHAGTGKQLISVVHLREVLGLDPSFPAICCQGAVAYGPDGKIVSLRALDKQTVLDVVEGTRQRPFGVFVFVHDAVYLVNDLPHPTRPQDWLTISRRYDKNVINARAEPARSDMLRRIASGELSIVKMTAACDEADVAGASVAREDSR